MKQWFYALLLASPSAFAGIIVENYRRLEVISLPAT